MVKKSDKIVEMNDKINEITGLNIDFTRLKVSDVEKLYNNIQDRKFIIKLAKYYIKNKVGAKFDELKQVAILKLLDLVENESQ